MIVDTADHYSYNYISLFFSYGSLSNSAVDDTYMCSQNESKVQQRFGHIDFCKSGRRFFDYAPTPYILRLRLSIYISYNTEAR